MQNFLKKHFGKIVVFVVNGLLVTIGVVAINNQQKEKESQLASEGQAANAIESTTAQLTDQSGLSPASTQNASGNSTNKIPNTKPAAPASTTVKKTTKNTSAVSTTAKTATSSSSTPVSAPKTAVTPAPVPTPAPAPAAKTKTS